MSSSPRGPAWRGLRFGRDVKMLAGYHPQETPHFNRDTTVTFQDTTVVSIDICSGSCIEIISPPPAQSIHDIVSLVAEPNWASVRFRQYTSTTSTCQFPNVYSLTLKAMSETAPSRNYGRQHWGWGHHENRAGTPTQWVMISMTTDNAVDVRFGLRVLAKIVDHIHCCNYSDLNHAHELRHLRCWSGK